MKALDEARAVLAAADAASPQMAAEVEPLDDINMEARPKVRAQKAELRRVATERVATINRERTAATKGIAGVAKWSEDEPQLTRQAMRDIEVEGAASPRRDVRDACDVALQYLLGKIRDGGGMPGPCIAWCNKHQVARLVPLPMCEEFRQKAEADLAPHVANLRAELGAWDRERAVVTATIDATLPPLESHIVVTVKERATHSG